MCSIREIEKMGGFDDLLAELEGTRWYQRRMIWFLLVPLFFLMPFAFLNQIFVLSVPDHWCSPPKGLEPETLGLSLDDWKHTFLPQELGPDFQMRSSRCQMYNVTVDNLDMFLTGQLPGNDSEELDKLACKSLEGWSYDQSEFWDTAVTDNDWVCDLLTRPTDLFTLGCVGLILGTTVFSALADFKGRRLSFYVSTLAMIVCQLIQIGVSHIYPAYVAFKILAFAAMLPLFQTPLNIITEISSINARGFVIGIGCVAWSLGNMTLPLIGWLIASWKWIRVVCVVPMVFVFFTWKIVPESPRWLVTQGRVEEARKIMTDMAETNRVDVPEDLDEKLQEVSEENTESAYGYLSLFSTKQLSLRTLAVTLAFTTSSFVYYQLVINIGNMAGNTFLNMFLLGLVEGPGCVGGVILGDRFGRRWTHFGLLFTNAILFFVLMWVVYIPSLSPLVIFLCMWIKMNISGSFVVSYVQAMEVFPTSVRQSGIGFATIISQTISIAGPYVVFLGATDLKLPYLIMFLVCVVGAISVSLLPETLGAKLPETLTQASTFGTDDKFFSFLPARDDFNDNTFDETSSTDFEVGEKHKEAFDWNPLMQDVFDSGKPGEDVNASLIKDLLAKHYRDLKESNV